MTRFDQPEPALVTPTLFDPPPLEPMPTLAPVEPAGAHRASESIQQSFERFDRANPWVAVELRRMALDLVDQGHTRIGIGMLWETLRYRYMRSTTDHGGTFKFNNNFRSRYARMLIESTPELADVIELRRVRTA